MSFRTIYGLTYSEKGWRMCNRDECDITRIPGLTLVDTAPLRKGAPLTILGAWLFWYDRNVEEISSSVWGWSATNDVASSNHLAGVAVDVNAPKYPWGKRVMPADRIAKIRAGMALFSLTGRWQDSVIYWGEDWSRADQMHYDLRFKEGDPRNDEFAAKLRAGYLGIYTSGTATPPVVAPPALSRADGYAVRIIAEGRRRGITPKGIQIALATGLVESNITVYANEKLPKSLALPHDAVGRDGLSVGIFQQQVKDTGNGWWWGDEATCMGVESSAGLFYDRLVGLPYNGDSKTPGAFAQQIQGSAFPARYDQRWGEAVNLYNRLAGTSPAPTQGDDDLSAEAERMIREMYDEYRKEKEAPSRSFLATDGAAVESPLGFLYNIDGNVWSQQLTWAYLFDVPLAVDVVTSVARNGSYDGSWVKSSDFNAWLDEFGQAYCQGLVNFKAALVSKLVGTTTVAKTAMASAAPTPVTNVTNVVDTRALEAEIARLSEQFENLRVAVTSPPASPVSTEVAQSDKTPGQIAGNVVDSVTDYTKHLLAMDAPERQGHLAALKALQPSNGDQA